MKMLEADISKKLKNFDLDLRFEAEDGCLGILGASGCGKSMTLKAVAGLVRPDRGKIRRDSSVLFDSGRGIDLPPQKRQVGYLFQDYALFPNMTVAQNIEAGLLRSRQDKSARREQVRRLICQFRLEGLENQYPARISGGQQQRTALARIFASDARCILLDEPFSAMDSYLREEMQMELARMIREFGGCMVLVSHDRDEIYRLCGRTMIMEKGRNVICGQTQVLFDQPRKLAAARLTGCKNISRIQKAGIFRSTPMTGMSCCAPGQRCPTQLPMWGSGLTISCLRLGERTSPTGSGCSRQRRCPRLLSGRSSFRTGITPGRASG